MGKTPRKASAGIVVALLMSAGCASTPAPVLPTTTMQQPATNRPSTWGSQNATGGTNSMTQGGATGLPNNQVVSNQMNSRPQTGQNFGTTGNFQNNFTNNSQPAGGYNPNMGANNVQPASYNQSGGGVQQAGYNSNQNGGGGVQQAGGWPSNAQTQQAGSSMGRNMSRNTDDFYSGGANSGSAPAPSWPTGGSNGANSQDPPPVQSPNNTGSSSKYQTLPFNSSRSGGY